MNPLRHWSGRWLGGPLASGAVLFVLLRFNGESTAPAATDVVSPWWLAWGAFWATQFCLQAVRFALGWGALPCAVARVLCDQVLRSRALILPLLVLFVVPSLVATTADPETPLRYRLQNFLTYGFGTGALVIGCLTILLACRNVAGELNDGSGSDLFVKPLGVLSYLCGKSSGLALLNLVLVGALGGYLFGVTELFFRRLQPVDSYDALAVENEVLAARKSLSPESPVAFHEVAATRLERLEREGSEWIEEQGGRQALLEQLEREARIAWRSLGPSQGRNYIFRGLAAARDAGGDVQLRYRLETPARSDGGLDFVVRVNGRAMPVHARVGIAQVLPLPASIIDESGELRVAVLNVAPDGTSDEERGSLYFPRDGLEVLYRQGTFAGNLFRTTLIQWTHAVFLGALAVASSTFLAFAVSTILSFVVWFLASVSGIVLQSLGGTSPRRHGGGGVWGAFNDYALSPLLRSLANVLREYSSLRPEDSLISGRSIDVLDCLSHCLWIGGGWTSVCVLVGWWVLSRRELARVQIG